MINVFDTVLVVVIVVLASVTTVAATIGSKSYLSLGGGTLIV